MADLPSNKKLDIDQEASDISLNELAGKNAVSVEETMACGSKMENQPACRNAQISSITITRVNNDGVQNDEQTQVRKSSRIKKKTFENSDYFLN